MNRHVIALGAVLVFGSLQGWPQEPPDVTLKIEAKLSDGAAFNIPAVGDGEMLGIVTLPEGRFVGIRVTPRMRSDTVQIDVSALTASKKKLSQATCDEVRTWNSENAGSYHGKQGASLLLSGLGRLGLPIFKVKVVRAGGPPRGEAVTRMPLFSASAGANILARGRSLSPMRIMLAEWRGWSLIRMLGNACRLVDAVSVAGAPYRRCRRRSANCRNIPITLIDPVFP